jgi:aldehyde dehydrogenase (NAD+)
MCGRNLILPSMDLAGRGAMVVMPDADLQRAAADAVEAAFGQAGQRLIGLVNILVHEGCAATFKQMFMERVTRLEVGNPMTDPDVAYGPLINARSATAFREHWEKGLAEGATLLTGGDQWTEANRTPQVKGNISHGVYMQPCVWEGVTPEMGLFRNQVLGPTVNLSTFKTFDEAMTWISDPSCRPALSLYTQDRALIDRFKRECRVDIVNINAATEGLANRHPFTGHGTHPGGRLALDGFTRWQSSNDPVADGGLVGEGAATLQGSTLQTDWDSL